MLVGLAVASIGILLIVATYRHATGRGSSPAAPVVSIDTRWPAGTEQWTDADGSSDADAPRALPSAYRGNMRIVGVVAVESGDRVPDAEVTCTPMGFGPRHPEELAALSMRTDASGFFSFGAHPDGFRYEVVAFTPSHYGCAEVSRAQATDGQLVITVSPVYYTRYEFLDPSHSPVARLPVDVRQLIRGRVLASTHAAWLEDASGRRTLARMGVRMPEDPHVVATAFTLPPGPPRAPTFVLDLPGFRPVTLDFEPRPLADWPKGEVVHLHESDDDRGRILYDVEIPEVAWPSEWGEWDRSLDFRIWFIPQGTKLYSSVNRRTPMFSLAPPVKFDLRDQNERPLRYAILGEGGRRVVRPEYPEYGFLRVRWPPLADSTKHHGATVRAKDEPEGRDIVGVDAFPGETYFGPLAAGDYDVSIQWFMAGSTSALSLVRHLGTVSVRNGANDFWCE
jgi:hypothetical protein